MQIWEEPDNVMVPRRGGAARGFNVRNRNLKTRNKKKKRTWVKWTSEIRKIYAFIFLVFSKNDIPLQFDLEYSETIPSLKPFLLLETF